MKQLLILFALFPVFLIGQNPPQTSFVEVLDNPERIVSTMHYEGKTWTDTVSADDHALQDSISKWEKDYRVYQGHTLPVDPARSKPIWKYSDLNEKSQKHFRIRGEYPIRTTELDNGMIRIEKIESESEFWKRKYHELLRDHLEMIEMIRQ